MSDRVFSGFDASAENIADALEALAADIRNDDASLTSHAEYIDVHMGDPIEWELSLSFTCTDEALYTDVTAPHTLGDDT